METSSKMTTQANILIIDEDVNMMDILGAVLRQYGHTVRSFTDPVSAIEELKSNRYDILLVNYLMSPVNGDRVIELVRAFDAEIYIILMSMHRDLAPSIETMQTLDIQAYFEKSSRFDQLIISIQSGIKYIEQMRKVSKMSIQLDQYLFDFAKILLNTVSAKDHYTGEHSKRVTAYCSIFANELELTPQEKENLDIAATFHDIGKIGIPDSVLLKEGNLTNDEYDTIKLHPIIGSNIFGVSGIFKDIVPIIKYHHERVDGKGYPDQLKGDRIPSLARILAICDSFDAIVARRPYKGNNSIDFALAEIHKYRGKQFDAVLAKRFIETVKKYPHEFEIIMSSTQE